MPETIVEKICQIMRGSSFDDAPEDAEAIFKAVLDDQREWGQERLLYVNTLEGQLDAYEKERLK